MIPGGFFWVTLGLPRFFNHKTLIESMILRTSIWVDILVRSLGGKAPPVLPKNGWKQCRKHQFFKIFNLHPRNLTWKIPKMAQYLKPESPYGKGTHQHLGHFLEPWISELGDVMESGITSK